MILDMLYAVWYRRSCTYIYVQFQTPIWMCVHALVIHLQLCCTRHYKNTPTARCPRSQTNYTSVTEDFSVARLLLEGITSKCNQAGGHLMGSGGTCRGLAGQDGVISKGLHSPKLFSELKMRKVIAGDRHSSANTNTKQFCLMHFTSIFKNWSPVSLWKIFTIITSGIS